MYTLPYLKWMTNKDLLYSTILCNNLCGPKKYSQPKSWELCVIWLEFLGLKPSRQHLKWPLEDYSDEVGEEEPGYIEVLKQRAGSLNVKSHFVK